MSLRDDGNQNGKTKPRVLLIGKGMINSSRLIETLVAHGWECEFATSYAEAHACLNTTRFALVLGEFHLPDGNASRIIPWLEGSRTTAFFSLSTGIVTWWLPALERGNICFGSCALRPGEFGQRLGESLDRDRY